MVFRPLFWPTLMGLLALVVLLGLGTWQLQRLAWKTDLIARVTARVDRPAAPLPPAAGWGALDLDALEYRPFAVSGTFDHAAEIHVFTSLAEPRGAFGGAGYWVVTPLRLAGGGTLLVNRGFVPEARKDPAGRPAGLVTGEVALTGLLRRSETPGAFVPAPDLDAGIWFARDVPAMAAHLGLADAAPFYLDARDSAPGGLPQGGETQLVFRNAHLEYALTWYGLAIALIAVYLAYHRAAGRLGAAREHDMTDSAYQGLEARFRRLHDIDGALAVLSWDQSTQMPAGGAVARGRQLATLSVIAHDMLTAPDMADLLAAAREEALDDWQAANLAEMARAWAAATAVPGELVGRIEEAKAAAEIAWREAREAADFSVVAAKLETLLGLVRESAACLARARGVGAYDALLDRFDPGLSSAAIDPLFDDLSAWLPPVIDEIVARQAAAPQPVMPEPPFLRAAQEAFGRRIMTGLGFDFARGRLDVSHHPFTGGIPDDSRITTRYDENDFATGLMGIIHETGHALYEQGLPARWRDQPVGRSRGMTVHESQSLIMEMQLGRGDAFIAWLAPRLAEAYGGHGPAWSADNLARLYHRVRRGFIRVDADEATYPLHVILRTRLERALIAGDLAIADLPAAWNDGMKASLGIVPPTDREGCLQDIHWYMGAFGYFPTYTLGALAAAQMNARIATTEPAVHAAAARGDFAPLLAWLRRNVHERASRHGTAELIGLATGGPLATSAFKAHIEARYLGRAG